MVVFPNAKINLGLHVIEKRSDGFHNIETVFYPVNWCDVLEIIPNTHSNEAFGFSTSGILIEGELKTNLIYKTWDILKSKYQLPNIKVHLHKHIPMGAGLGGGSSDAAFFIELCNKQFNLNISLEEKIHLAASLGSDCGFFIHNRATFAEQKGDVFSDIGVDLSMYYILVVYPAIHSNTSHSYKELVPKKPQEPLKKIISTMPVKDWKNNLVNDFETTVFLRYPEISHLKQELYKQGALYASMSGSGSAVYGIFEMEPTFDLYPSYSMCLQKPV